MSKVSNTVQQIMVVNGQNNKLYNKWWQRPKIKDAYQRNFEEQLQCSVHSCSYPYIVRSQSPTQNSTSKLSTTIETTKHAAVLQNPMKMAFLLLLPKQITDATPTTSEDAVVVGDDLSWIHPNLVRFIKYLICCNKH